MLYDAMYTERRQQGRVAAMRALLAWEAHRQPRLLIVEDIHWARPSLLRTVAQLAHTIQERPVTLVITARIEGDPLDSAWRTVIAGVPLTTVDLSPLRPDEARAICETMVNNPQAVAGFVSRAGGNPLFLEQLLRHAKTRPDDKVPGSIQSLVQSVVDRLSEGDRKTVQAASIVGQRVDPVLLHFLVGGGEENLKHLVARNMLRSLGQDYLFVHALIRDAIYASLLTSIRTALHRRAADWFEERDHKLNAEHLALAGAPEAPRAFLLAATEEFAKYNYENALVLIERGLSVASVAADIVGLRLLAGETWHAFGRMAEAQQEFL